MNSVDEKLRNSVEQMLSMLRSVDHFNDKELRPSLLKPTQRSLKEQCIQGNYVRAIANVKTLVTLTIIKDAQAIAMLARSLFELAVEIELIDRIQDAPPKVFAFGQYEALRRSRKILKFVETHTDRETHLDAKTHKEFVNRSGSKIDAESVRTWPKSEGRPTHWSERDLRKRAELIGGVVWEMYESEYQMYSWYTHVGILGVMSDDERFYWNLCGIALSSAADSYEVILRSVVRVFDFMSVDSTILDKLEIAKCSTFFE